MVLLAKIALTGVATMAMATVYTFRQGTIRVDVDEHHEGGTHVHVWVPAALVPMAVHFIPNDKLQQAEERADEWLPIVRAVSQSLGEHPQANFVEVQDRDQHVRVSTEDGRIRVDVKDEGEEVHVLCPISTIQDVAEQIGARAPHM